MSKTMCDSCERDKDDVHRYVIADDLYGHKNVRVSWCDECFLVHTTRGPPLTVRRVDSIGD